MPGAERHEWSGLFPEACSGVGSQTLILSLPGSERAAVENLRAILPALPHGLRKLAIPRTAGEFLPDRLRAR
jgi:molybdopterin biosynthesis enzyme MoaB